MTNAEEHVKSEMFDDMYYFCWILERLVNAEDTYGIIILLTSIGFSITNLMDNFCNRCATKRSTSQTL